MNTLLLYFMTWLLAGVVTAVSLPLLRATIGPAFLDAPTSLKRHAHSIPAVGGCALFIGLSASLIFIRCTTDFPTGTLHCLRGILCGAAIIFALGILDDLCKPKGLSISVKLLIQCLAVCCLLRYRVHISLFDSPVFSCLLTFLWVIGITNAFNLLDIADGLCVSQAVICTLGLVIISLPSEQIYVNFAACALLGACLGFWPYNHWESAKTFLGDSGSTLLGFLIAALAMGADYSETSHVGFLAPLFILAIPLFDTTFVSFMRLLQGKNPLRASNDHAALRLRQQGFSPRRILLIFLLAGLLFNGLAFWITRLPLLPTLCLCTVSMGIGIYAAYYLAHIRMAPHE